MSKKFIEVTAIDKGNNEPQRALIDTDLIASATEVTVKNAKIDSRVNCVIVLARGEHIQDIRVTETFNEIRNRLAAALS